jgi:hypothetical protein
MDHIARNMLRMLRAGYSGQIDYPPASPSTHGYVAWRQYDELRRELEREGFRYLADLVALSAHVTPKMSRPAVVRLLADESNEVLASLYHLPLRWTLMGIIARFLGGGGFFLDLTTDFEDGASVQPTTAKQAGSWTAPPQILSEHLPRSTTFPHAIARHRERVRAYRAEHPAASPVRFSTLDDIHEAFAREARIRHEYRQSIGWATREEMARVTNLSGARLDQFEAAFRRAVNESGP